jgi:hypothetical protein
MGTVWKYRQLEKHACVPTNQACTQPTKLMPEAKTASPPMVTGPAKAFVEPQHVCLGLSASWGRPVDRLHSQELQGRVRRHSPQCAIALPPSGCRLAVRVSGSSFSHFREPARHADEGKSGGCSRVAVVRACRCVSALAATALCYMVQPLSRSSARA